MHITQSGVSEQPETTMLGRKILLTIPPFIMHWVKVESDVALFQEVQQEPFRLTDNWSHAEWIRFRFKEIVTASKVEYETE